MAKVQKAILTEYTNDGSVVMSNIRKGKADLPVIGGNETYSATLVTEWYDGSPMDDSKADGAVYLKYKGTEYPNYTGSYFRVNLSNWGETFLQKPNVASLRNLSSTEILLLRMGYYKGVNLLGYYAENGGDIPTPIEYYLSDTAEEDDGGSVFEVGGIKLEHDFGNDVDVRYYGYHGMSSQKSSINKAALRYSRLKVTGDCDFGSGISITKDNFTIYGVNCNITITEEGDYGIRLNGDNNSILSINLDGENLCQRGLSINGTNPTIEYNTVKNCFGETMSSSGIYIENTAGQVYGADINWNKIHDISSPNTGENGDSLGASRGIVISGFNLNNNLSNKIFDNVIYNITGREGDGIQVLSINGSSDLFEKSYTNIFNNKVTSCNRRYIKIQSSFCYIKNNELKNNLTLSELTNSLAGIEAINSESVTIEDNYVDSTFIPHGISILNDVSVFGENNSIKYNSIISGTNTAWSNVNSQKAIYCNNQKSIDIFKNNISNNGYIELRGITHSNISYNIINNTGTNTGAVGIRLISNCYNNVVESNQGYSNTSKINYFIDVLGYNNKIIGNTAMYDPSQTYSVVRLSGVDCINNEVSENSGDSRSFSGISIGAEAVGKNYIKPNNKVSFGNNIGGIFLSNSIPTEGTYKVGDIALASYSSTRKNLGWICTNASSSVNPAGLWMPIGIVGNYTGNLNPEGTQDAPRGSLYNVVGSDANPLNLLYLKTTTGGGNTGWQKIITQNILATPTVKGLVNQAVASADTAEQAAGATPTKAEFDALLSELRDLKTKARTAGILAT